MQNVKLNLKNSTISEKELMKYADQVTMIHEELHQKVNYKSEFLGWLELPTNYDKIEVENIKKAAKEIRTNSEVLVVIGIGGSYLGARSEERRVGKVCRL